MQRKLLSHESDFDFLTLRNEFDEAVRSNDKKDKSIGNLTNRSFSAVDLHKNSNLFTKILKFIPEETVANLFNIFQHEFDTNKKSTMKEVNSLRLEISFEYKRKILEILLFLLFAIKHSTAENFSSRNTYISKRNSLKLTSRVNSFTLRGDQKILFQVNKTKSPNRNMPRDKEIDVETIIEEPKSVNVILNYTETKNKEVNLLKENTPIASSRENKFMTHYKDKDIPLESDKINLNLKTPTKTISIRENNKESGKSSSLKSKIHDLSSVNSVDAMFPVRNESEINQRNITSDVTNDRQSDKSKIYDGTKDIQMVGSGPIFSQNLPKFSVFPENMQKSSHHGPRQFSDPKYYHPNNMRVPYPHPYFFNYPNSDQMKINNTPDAYNYNNLLRMSYNHYIANPAVPLIRRQYNINMPPINHFSQSTYMHPEIARNYTDAYKTPQYPIIPNVMSNSNKVNTAVINFPENINPDKGITNMNPFYVSTEGSKMKENETVTAKENTVIVSSGNNSNDFLKKKKKRDDASKTTVTQSYTKADTSAERSSKIDHINITHNDDVQVKMFNDEIQNECILDCSTNEVDKSILLTSPNTLPTQEVFSSNDPSESFLSITGMNISLTNSKEDEIVKKLVTIFNQKQFTMSSLEALRQTLKLSEEKTNLIKEYLINKKYPKNQKDYIFLFKKEQEEKGLYLKIDAIKKMYSLIRHRIIKESDYK